MDDGGPSSPTGAERPAFPPGLWLLRGNLFLSVLRVPRAIVPRLDDVLPPGYVPVMLAGDVLLGVALAEYAPSGDLAHDELLTAVLVRPTSSVRTRSTIPQIWVTTAESVAGGRGLWAVPKERCEVERREPAAPIAKASVVRAEVTYAGRDAARLTAEVGRRLLPGRIPVAPDGPLGRARVTPASPCCWCIRRTTPGRRPS